jgi:alkanesulfonate monooxygenase SsuD/methylene tetrahydromethanopterin reductase-like flavin-dependent oxidoreductase (luciferase family)
MRIGCMLPTFRRDAAAVTFATAVEDAGLDGVFVFDHMWPMRQPARPALYGRLVLAAVAASTSRISLGTLVSRVGLVPDECLIAELLTLQVLSGDRLIAGIGVGDSKSADEHEAYGLPMLSANERRGALRTVASALRGADVPVWIGAGARLTNEVAREVGAAINVWERPPSDIGRLADEGADGALRSGGGAASAAMEVTWGGVLPAGDGESGRLLAELAGAGVSWAVVAQPGSLDSLVAAVERSGVRRDDGGGGGGGAAPCRGEGTREL